MSELDRWPGSIAGKIMLAEAVGQFLRAHRDGDGLLLDWLYSVPPDRTEVEYHEECRLAAAEHRRLTLQLLFEDMRRQARIPDGTPIVDPPSEPLVLSEDQQLRNLARLASMHFALRLALPARDPGESARSWRQRLIIGLIGCGPWWPLGFDDLTRLPPDRLDCCEEETLEAAETLIAQYEELGAPWAEPPAVPEAAA